MSLLPQAYLSNFHNRVKNEDVPLFTAAQLSRNKRGKQVNYAEFDTDLLDEFIDRNDEDDLEDDVDDSDGRRRGGDYYESAEFGKDGANRFAGVGVDDKGDEAGGNGVDGVAGTVGSGAVGAGAGAGVGTGVGGAVAAGAGSNVGGVDGGVDANGNAGSGSTGEDANRIKLNDLPDLESQDDTTPLALLKYPRIRETFVQSRIAISYKDLLGDSIQDAQQLETEVPIMVPIRLNIEFSGHKLVDFFMWNLNDHSMSPEQFATILCQDLDFPVLSNPNNSPYTQIISMINEQLQEYETLASLQVPDLHVIINLTANLDSKLYDDTFEWNLNDDSLCPEQFAELVVQDLGLQREFVPAIAHSLHESLLKVKKDWLEGNLNLAHVENKAAFGYTSGIRLDIDTLGASWFPKVEVLSQWEIEKREIEKERNMRRLKRESAKVDDGRSRRRGKRRMDDLETTLRI
ncbi:unnamed protein product [Kluyveromyces dobzhanskii CBS 2104]|uniref:WGS project CCBQ000000000 data, contig 00009 n=1 Tax=Kluyveromyces dobzhanskii CBS 2104 TaxID=1427455 RepID=A0A0A8L596_9SACH|nr:unnamed protein product [Kluyveromyces dobzhanskii CBS 2104]